MPIPIFQGRKNGTKAGFPPDSRAHLKLEASDPWVGCLSPSGSVRVGRNDFAALDRSQGSPDVSVHGGFDEVDRAVAEE